MENEQDKPIKHLGPIAMDYIAKTAYQYLRDNPEFHLGTTIKNKLNLTYLSFPDFRLSEEQHEAVLHRVLVLFFPDMDASGLSSMS